MTIKQNGGIFGRNPEFNDVSAKDVSVTDEITILENGVDVGGVRSLSGQAQLSGTTTGITFGAQSVLPTNGGSAIQNGTRDIGGASNFWRNVYVSTGVYFGSQTTATHLDDYEEGVFTPTYVTTGTDFDSVNYDTQDGHYTKVGNMVNARVYLSTDGITVGSASGTVRIGGLPFAAANSRNSAIVWAADFTGDHPHIAQASGSELVLYYQTTSNGSSNNALAIADLNTGLNDNTVIISICYQSS